MTKCTKQKERSKIYKKFHWNISRKFTSKAQEKKIELKKAEEALAKFNNDPNAAALSILTSGL